MRAFGFGLGYCLWLIVRHWVVEYTSFDIICYLFITLIQIGLLSVVDDV